MKTNTAASAVELDLEIELHRSTEGMGKEEIAELREQLRLMGRQLEDMAYFVEEGLAPEVANAFEHLSARMQELHSSVVLSQRLWERRFWKRLLNHADASAAQRSLAALKVLPPLDDASPS